MRQRIKPPPGEPELQPVEATLGIATIAQQTAAKATRVFEICARIIMRLSFSW
jgi:hypothetical protein